MLKVHTSSKSTRSHDVISVIDYSNLPKSVLNIRKRCEEHDAALEHFCVVHDCPCCQKCLNTTHKTCKNIPAIDDVISNAKSSTALQSLEEELLNGNKILNDVALEKNRNVEEVQNQADTIINDIKRRRSELNTKLDIIERNAIQALESAKTGIINNIENQKRNIEEKSGRLGNLLENIDKLKKYGSNLQVFLGVREFGKATMKEELFIDREHNENLYKIAHIAYKETTDGLGINKFGDITIKYTDSTVNGYQQNTAQFHDNFKDIDLQPLKTIKIQPSKTLKTKPVQNCFGCTILPNGKLILADSDGFMLIILNNGGSVEKSISLDEKPYDVEVLTDKNLVAVSLCNEPNVIIVNVKKGTTIKTIHMDDPCCGIGCVDKKLFVSTIKGIKRVDLGGNRGIRNLKIGSKVLNEYVDIHKNIYSSADHTVTCFGLDGNLLWTLKDDRVLQGARGIKVHETGIVFVACPLSRKIVAISSSGTRQKSFYIDLVGKPRTLCFDKDDGNKLLICGWDGDLAIYRVSF